MSKVYKIMFTISIGLTLAAIVVTFVLGLNLSADFRGGSILEVNFEKNRPSADAITKVAGSISGITNINVSPTGTNGAIIRMSEINEIFHQKLLGLLKQDFGNITEAKFDSIGPTIGQELKSKSITAIVVLLLAISIYIAIVFRKISQVLSSWSMSFAAIAALLHDVFIPIGIFAVLGRFYGVEINAVFVAAILTILGYSISDTVVVFDRVRENVIRFGFKEDFGQLVHRSIMQTLSRSLNTTFTTLLSLIAIYFFGGETIRFFVLALIMGIFLGAYSSIFVASPILVWRSNRRR